MEAEEILARVDAGSDVPSDWTVLPIIRRNLIMGMVEWVFGVIMGGGLFALIASVVIPSNYEHGAGLAVFSTILLGICLFIGVASLYLLVVDSIRLSQAAKHRIVLTPEGFLKQTGDKIIYVPMSQVRYVTSRGKPRVESTMPTSEETNVSNVPGTGENVAAFFFGRGMTKGGKRWRRNRLRTPTSVAFIDARHNKEVLVLNDTTYGDPYSIGTLLKEYAAEAQVK